MSNTRPEEPRRWSQLRKQLYQEATAGFVGGDAALVKIGLYKHGIIAPVLRQLAYDPKLKGEVLNAIFEDGSQPTPFPCGQLANRGVASEIDLNGSYPSEFHLGLMSLRHPEMDYLVDFYIIRNRDVYDHDSTAEVEDHSFRESVKLLTDPWLEGGGLLRIYQTGLEPVIIGFYRALVATQLWRHQQGNTNPLVVQPRIYVGHDTNKKLSPNSHGANPDNYIPSPSWW